MRYRSISCEYCLQQREVKLSNILFYLIIAILVYFGFLMLWYLTLLIFAYPEVVRTFKETQYGNIEGVMHRNILLPLTIIIPAFNEEKRILNCVYALLKSDYKHISIIVMCDGSQDKTLEVLTNEFKLYETPLMVRETIKSAKLKHAYQSATHNNLLVVDKEHGPNNNGADSLNAGLNMTTTPLVLSVDADTILAPRALTNILFKCISTGGSIAVGGSVYVLNENIVKKGELYTANIPRKLISAIQCIEYLRAFIYGRAGLNVLGGALSYPGAFTLFETNALRKVGGYDSKNYSYDTEMTLKLHRFERKLKRVYAMPTASNALGWTEVPATWKSYWMQRNKWQRGMLRSTFNHAGMFLNPKYGVLGMLTFPCYVLFELFGPVVEFISYFLLVIVCFVSWHAVAWFVFLAWGYSCFLSVATYHLNMITYSPYRKTFDVFKVVWIVTAQMFGFRQFNAACCFLATIQYFFNRLRGKYL